MRARLLLAVCSMLVAAVTACTDSTAPPVNHAVPNAPLASAASSIQITDLGTMGGLTSFAVGINDNGLIVGASEVVCPPPCPFDEPPTHAFVWQNGQFTDLGTMGGENSHANAINAAGIVVGSSAAVGDTERPVKWQNGQVTDLGTFGGPSGVAYGINVNGVIVGTADQPTGQFIRFTGFKWQNGVLTNLGVLPGGDWSVAQGINNSGVIVGQGSSSIGAIRALMWSNGQITDLGNLEKGKATAFATALAINDAGQVVGYSDTRKGQHAFLFQNGTMTDLGRLPGIPPGSVSAANAINSAGQIVGYMTAPGQLAHAVLWSGGVATDLGVLPKGNVSVGGAINTAGVIAGTANTTVSGSSLHRDHAAKWVVTP
jgi:probable HAF family extracellular repeat protein